MPPPGTTSYLVRAGDLPALRGLVGELAAHDQLNAERLIGQLAHLEALKAEGDRGQRIDFTPPPGCDELAQRAVDALYEASFGGRGRSRRLH